MVDTQKANYQNGLRIESSQYGTENGVNFYMTILTQNTFTYKMHKNFKKYKQIILLILTSIVEKY